MADLTYQVQVDTNQAQQSLAKLQGSVGKLDVAFGRLKGVLAGAAFASFSRAAIQMADQIQDLSDVTGIATHNILAFQKAVELGGGSAESASKGLLTFYQSIDEAAGGGIKAQAAFDTLGIKLNDLATLSEQGLLNKTLEQLSKMQPSAQKTALQAELLGKAFRGIIIDPEFITRLQAGEAEAAKTAATIKRAAELNDQWTASIGKIKLAFLEAFGPAISSMATMLEMLPKLTTAFKILGVVIATALGIGAARQLVGIIGMIGRGVTTLFSGAKNLGKVFGSIGTGSSQGLGKLRDVITALVAPITAVASALALFWDTWFKTTKAEDENTDATKANIEAQREAKSAIEAKVVALKQQVAEFDKANKASLAQINLDTHLIGKSKEYSDLLKAQNDLTKRTVDEVDKLSAAKKALSAEEQQLGLGAEYDKQIAKVYELAKAEQERVTAAIKNANAVQQAQELNLFGIRAEQEAQDKLLQLQRDTADIGLTEIEKKYKDITRAAEDSAKAAIRAEEARRGAPLSTAEIEKYYGTARKGVNDLISAQNKLYTSSRTFSAGWNKSFKEYADAAKNAAATATRVFDKFTQGLEDLFVEFAKTGKFEWKGFVNSLLEELLRAQIKETLANVLSIKNPLSSSGGSISDMFGGIFGALGSNQQRGQSANAPMYVIDVSKAGGSIGGLTGKAGAASSGGGIFDTISNAFSGITSGIGSIFSGTAGNYGTNTGSQQSRMLYDQEAGMGGGFFDAIGSGISSAVSGISDFFGGFFANGGTIPAGKFGVVGERGPELIGGPANITPMGGGNVTFNINAVDAPSFQALLAKDPGFLYAVAMKGAGSIPMGR